MKWHPSLTLFSLRERGIAFPVIHENGPSYGGSPNGTHEFLQESPRFVPWRWHQDEAREVHRVERYLRYPSIGTTHSIRKSIVGAHVSVSHMARTVAVVILNWNGWRDTLECLESLYQATYDAIRVVLVDNGSSDESIVRFTEYCSGAVEVESRIVASRASVRPTRLVELTRSGAEALSSSQGTSFGPLSRNDLVLIKNERNYGFAKGCNIGTRFSLSVLDADYVLLLNNDTVVAPDFLDEMVRVGDSDEMIGILGPKILYYDYGGRNDVIWFAGGVIKPWRDVVLHHVGTGEIDKGQFDSGGETEWCSGAAMLIKKKLAKTALLNTAYKFGMEDVEYCLKARKRGYRVVYVPSAKVWHKSGVSRRKLGRRIARDITGHFRLIRENFSSAVYLYHVLLFFAIVLPRWAVTYFAEGCDGKTMREFLRDMRQFFVYMTRGCPKE